jgi:hypothetical protein
VRRCRVGIEVGVSGTSRIVVPAEVLGVILLQKDE